MVLLLSGCGEPTDLSYDELVDEYREEFGPFSYCGADFSDCEEGARTTAACLATGITTCTPIEHVFYDYDNGELSTTFVTPVGDSCEVIVLRDLESKSLGTDYERLRCDSVEISDLPPCIRFRGCDVEKRWNHRR